MASRQTSGIGLSADEAFEGLVDFGLFSEKLPPCFTSEGLSKQLPKTILSIETESDERKMQQQLKNRTHDFIRSETLRETNVPRQIGIPHPESYVVQCLSLKRHWTKIKKHCEQPEPPVTRVYVRKMKGKHVFRMNYRGKERSVEEDADIINMMGSQYKVLTDISNCFPSIYTHSIPWSMHSRSKSKKNRSPLLMGNLLDKATQCARDGQTNGLLIGPHASNVISEIILTKIDDAMIKRGFRKFSRYVDDYTFYAKTHQEAEDFIRTLGLELREYELGLNSRKTEILAMPLPLNKDWVRELNSFPLPGKERVARFRDVRSFLDLALRLAGDFETYAVLNYAIKMVPHRLDSRAKRLFVQEAINLALLYPYLCPILQEHVFEKCYYNGIDAVISQFIEPLLEIGVQKIYPDAIAFALYYSLKQSYRSRLIDSNFGEIIKIDDCLSIVLLLQYARLHRIENIQKSVRAYASKLRDVESREQDRYWLLIYQLWRAKTLDREGQSFLAGLKRKRFSFLRFK